MQRVVLLSIKVYQRLLPILFEPLPQIILMRTAQIFRFVIRPVADIVNPDSCVGLIVY